jgi:restriction endonuclease S subunit
MNEQNSMKKWKWSREIATKREIEEVDWEEVKFGIWREFERRGIEIAEFQKGVKWYLEKVDQQSKLELFKRSFAFWILGGSVR